jgi:pyruvate/2-oxoglutarate dehydrogenase complex dihydrolipoamide dehydrogenase (E3) component/uncharacterized membrane protein YdjX (TVP38/TMEM64 family)
MESKLAKKHFIFWVLIFGIIGLYIWFDIASYLNVEYAKTRYQYLEEFEAKNSFLATALFFGLYVLVAALSIPGVLVMTLLGGAIFGFFKGFLLTSFASTIGATIAFSTSRFLLRDWVKKRFKIHLLSFISSTDKDQYFYLFSLRMIPIFPFFLVNLLMGLTKISWRKFYFISQLGMATSSAVYVNAGSELAQITSMSDLLSIKLLLSFTLLGVLPLFSRWLVARYQKNRIYRNYFKPLSYDADVIVIGGGAGGLVTSLVAANAKAKVILIEKDKQGGECLYTGCVPSKSVIRSSKIMSYLRRASEFGIVDAQGRISFPSVMHRVKEIIQKIEPHDSVERYRSLGVDCYKGTAIIKTPFMVHIGNKKITTRSIVVATGSRPRIPEIEGSSEVGYLTSENIWSIDRLPNRFLIIGGGAMGCELAQAFQNFGSNVVQIESAVRLLSQEDKEVSLAIQDKFNEIGVDVLVGHRLLKFKRIEEQKSAVVQRLSDGVILNIVFDQVLYATGRNPNIENFGLEELGVEISQSGGIKVNACLQTNFPNIFAVGDVLGSSQHTNIASYQGLIAATNSIIEGIWELAADYRVVPYAIFTDPEVARVGLCERDARAAGIAFDVCRYDLTKNDRLLTEGEASGFVTVLTAEQSDEILGVTIVGHHASEQIAEFVFAMTHRMGLKSLSQVIHIYPTVSESNRLLASSWRSQNIPKYLRIILDYFLKIRRG